MLDAPDPLITTVLSDLALKVEFAMLLPKRRTKSVLQVCYEKFAGRFRKNLR